MLVFKCQKINNHKFVSLSKIKEGILFMYTYIYIYWRKKIILND